MWINNDDVPHLMAQDEGQLGVIPRTEVEQSPRHEDVAAGQGKGVDLRRQQAADVERIEALAQSPREPARQIGYRLRARVAAQDLGREADERLAELRRRIA